MKQSLLLIITTSLLLCCAALSASAQPRYYNRWYFGERLGLNFTLSPPLRDSGKMTSLEGCASICDPVTGQKLFYTNGLSVWNRNDSLMKNGTGLFGHLSATQSSLILPDPGDSLRFYIFTLDGLTPDPGGTFTGQGRGLNYSVVDMLGDTGLGEVVLLNDSLFQKASEKLVGVRHAYGCGFWIVTHELESNRFFAWHLSALGLSGPVISSVGPVYGDRDAGYLKASPDGSMLIAVRGLDRFADLLSFDPATGKVDSLLAGFRADYGASFSPNNDFLYAGSYEGGAVLTQYDLRNGPGAIVKTPLDTVVGDAAFQGMQIGPDGRIYTCYRDDNGQTKLGVITAPNNPGAACNYEVEYEFLIRVATNYLGLPNCVDGFLGESQVLSSITAADLILTRDTVLCPGEQVRLKSTQGVSYRWYPSDSLSCADCSDPIASPISTTTYVLFSPGEDGCLMTDSVTITVADLPAADAGRDTVICPGDSVQLSASGGVGYLWSPAGELSCATCPNPMASPNTTTTYTVVVAGETGCAASDQVTVTVRKPNVSIIASGLAICRGDEIRLTASGGISYQWSPADGLDCVDCPVVIARPSETTTYSVQGITEGGCGDSASITIVVYDTPVVDAGNDTTICPGQGVNLKAEGAFEYEWSPADGLSCTDCPDPTAFPGKTMTYIVRGRKENICFGVDSVTVTVSELPVANAVGDTTICAGESVRLAVTGGGGYLWSPAQSLDCDTCAGPTATPTVTTTYHVQVVNEYGCAAWDSVTVTVQSSGVVDAAGDTAFCLGGTAQLNARGAESYRWSPAEGLSCTDCANPTARPSRTTTYYVLGTNTGGGCPAVDSVRVEVHPLPEVDAGSDTAICGDVAELHLHVNGAMSYQWDPSPDLSCLDCSDPIARPSRTTTYYVMGRNEFGCASRDSVRVEVHPGLTVSGGEDRSLCIGESAQLQATGGVRWLWEPSEGLSCDDCPNPVASPQGTTEYVLTGWSAEGCVARDTLTVHVRTERQIVRLRIARWYHGKIDSVIRIGLESDGPIGVTDIRELRLELQYDLQVMQVDTGSFRRLLPQTGLTGWDVEFSEYASGRVAMVLRSSTGVGLSGQGVMLAFEGRLYLSDKRGTELPFRVETGSGCFVVETSAGYAEVDSICGLSLRLFELSEEKYVAPVAYPNPARDRVRIEFGLGLDGPTELEVFDAEGRRVGLLVSSYLSPGRYSVEWEVGGVSSGLYWYRLRSGSWSGVGELRISE